MADEPEEPAPDDICVKYADLGVKIQVTDLDDEYVFLEGTKAGLEFLAELFWAQARDTEHKTNNLSPFAAGNALFTSESTRGIEAHWVCLEPL